MLVADTYRKVVCFRHDRKLPEFRCSGVFRVQNNRLHLSGPSAPDCTVCCLLLDACPVLPSQLDNATNTATPNTQVFTEHQVTDSQFHSLSLLSLFFSLSLFLAVGCYKNVLHVRCGTFIQTKTITITTTTKTAAVITLHIKHDHEHCIN